MIFGVVLRHGCNSFSGVNGAPRSVHQWRASYRFLFGFHYLEVSSMSQRDIKTQIVETEAGTLIAFVSQDPRGFSFQELDTLIAAARGKGRPEALWFSPSCA
jgi:hypothetical protein